MDLIFSQVVVLVLLGLLQLLFGLLPLLFQSLLQKELSKALKRFIGNMKIFNIYLYNYMQELPSVLEEAF